MLLKYKKIKRLQMEQEFKKWRESQDPKGYVHDLEETRPKTIHADAVEVFEHNLSDEEDLSPTITVEEPRSNKLNPEMVPEDGSENNLETKDTSNKIESGGVGHSH